MAVKPWSKAFVQQARKKESTPWVRLTKRTSGAGNRRPISPGRNRTNLIISKMRKASINGRDAQRTTRPPDIGRVVHFPIAADKIGLAHGIESLRVRRSAMSIQSNCVIQIKPFFSVLLLAAVATVASFAGAQRLGQRSR
jgi:hypothetical protein